MEDKRAFNLKDNEAAHYIGMKTQTLRNWRAMNRGPAYVKVGRAVRYSLNDLDAYMTERRVQPDA
jgi:predicted DNA-binding transcriptional regulator AlpA